MNETLNKALIAIINGATAATNTAVDFLSREIPLVVKELLLYKFVWNLSWFLVGLGMLITGLVFLYKMVVLGIKAEREYRESFPHFLGGLIAALFICTVAVPVTVSNTDWLQIWLAPRIYLIEYAAQLYKGMPK